MNIQAEFDLVSDVTQLVEFRLFNIKGSLVRHLIKSGCRTRRRPGYRLLPVLLAFIEGCSR